MTPGVCGSQPLSPGNRAAPSFLSELPLLTLTRIFCYPSSWDPLTVPHSAVSSSAVPPPSTIDAGEKAGGLVDQSPDRFFPFSVQGGFAFQPCFPQTQPRREMLTAQTPNDELIRAWRLGHSGTKNSEMKKQQCDHRTYKKQL